MGKVLFAVIVAVAFLAMGESLVCNKCTFSLFGFCLGASNNTCAFNTSVCSTGKLTFPALSSFSGFTIQGCQDNTTGCNITNTGSLLSVSYQTNLTCCSTDRCNTVTLSNGAPSTKMPFAAAVAGAVLASVWRSVL